MSRCLRFNPLDYARKAVSKEASLEPIKLQRDMEKAAKSHRKKEKREIKRQGRKQENVIPGYATVHNAKSFDDKKSFHQDKDTGEADELEKSDITNEHEPPACAENSCYLSDNTQSSKKRESQTVIIRIKPLRKHSEPDASLACCTSGRTEIVLAPNQPSAENAELEVLPSKSGQDLSSPTLVGIEAVDQKIIGSTSTEDQLRREDSPYATLMDNWIPSHLQRALNDTCDDEWLFQTKQQDRCGSKRYKANNEVSCGTSCTVWPRAQLLPEVGVWALPFTIPL